MELALLGPAGLFALFAVLATTGAHLAVTQLKGRRAGLLAAALTLLFFALLGGGLLVLLRQARMP